MTQLEILKYLSIFLASTLFFFKIGMPMAVLVFKFHFIKCVVTTCLGSISTFIVSYLMSDKILVWVKKRRLNNQKKIKRFLKFKSARKILNVKSKFGMWGILILTPILLSNPLGAFLVRKFYKKPVAFVFSALAIITVIWAHIIYFILYAISLAVN